MSVWSAIVNSNNTSNIEDAFNTKDITSFAMKNAQIKWLALYFEAESSEGKDPCLRLPVTIVNKLYKTIFSEYFASVDGSQKAFLSDVLERIEKCKKKAVQYALIGGEVFIKPVISGKSFDFIPIRRDAFVPFSRDAHGKITSVGSAEKSSSGGRFYTLLERRTVDNAGTLTIENRLYSSDTEQAIGVQIPLDRLERYANLQPEVRIPGVYNLGMVQMRVPVMNTVDGSFDGVAVYDAASGLICNANRNEWQLNKEFENGGSRIIASEDMLKTDERGRKQLSDSLFVALDEDPQNVGVTIFNPTLRESSYFAREQNYLRSIENLIGLKRGILSEVEAAERTATEITSSAGDYNLTIQDFQNEWTSTLKELLSTCVTLGSKFGMTSEGGFDPESDLSVDWGDGVLFNRDKAWSEISGMVASGLLKPELALAWYYNEPHDTPEDLQRIREKYMPEVEALEDGE